MKYFAFFLISFLLAGCFGSPLEQVEEGFQGRMARLDEIIAKSEGDLRKEAEAQKARFTEEYRKLPPKEKEERVDALGKLNQDSYGYLETAGRKLDEGIKAKEEAKNRADTLEMDAYRAKFVGVWKSPEMELTITRDGSVDYKRLKSGLEKKATASIQKFEKDKFTVGFLGITTTFKIDKPPYEENALWKMVIDGVELTRTTP